MLARGPFVLLLLAVLAVATPASARAMHDSPYTFDQTFGSTLRLLKVDMELEVTETNAEWGYVLFVYTNSESGSRKNRGSFTFVRDEHGVHVALQIPEMPSYHEQMIIDQLRRKLETEHGEPPPPPPKKPKEKKKPKADDEDKPADPPEGEPAPKPKE